MSCKWDSQSIICANRRCGPCCEAIYDRSVHKRHRPPFKVLSGRRLGKPEKLISEQATPGIEPGSPAQQAEKIPLGHTRLTMRYRSATLSDEPILDESATD